MFIFDNLHIKCFNPSTDKTNYRENERNAIPAPSPAIMQTIIILETGS